MEIHTIGIDLGKTVFHLVGLDVRGEVVVRKEVFPQPDSWFYSEPACVLDRHGSLRRSALSCPCPA